MRKNQIPFGAHSHRVELARQPRTRARRASDGGGARGRRRQRPPGYGSAAPGRGSRGRSRATSGRRGLAARSAAANRQAFLAVAAAAELLVVQPHVPTSGQPTEPGRWPKRRRSLAGELAQVLARIRPVTSPPPGRPPPAPAGSRRVAPRWAGPCASRIPPLADVLSLRIKEPVGSRSSSASCTTPHTASLIFLWVNFPCFPGRAAGMLVRSGDSERA